MSKIKTFNSNFKEVIEEKLTRQFFMKLIGFKITKIEEGNIEGELEVEQIHKQQKGFLHGGVTATIADIVAGFAAFSLVEEGSEVVTAEIKVSYYNPAISNKIFAKGWVEKQGKKLNFCEAIVWEYRGEEKVIIAKASTTMATITQKEIKNVQKK